MAKNNKKDQSTSLTEVSNFRTNRAKVLEDLYADEASTARRYNNTVRGGRINFSSALQVREALKKAIQNRTPVVEASRQLYAINPIYAGVINYLANMFVWRYKVTPHKVYKKSKAQQRKELSKEDYMLIYHEMLEVVDGMAIESKFPSILSLLFTQGAVYLTTYYDDETYTMDTLLLPDEFCRKIGETQYGTAIIEFNFSYFDNLGLTQEQLKDYFKSFPKEFEKKYRKYQKDSNFNWQELDPHFSTGILLNEYSIPTFLYVLSGILDYEQYQDNELERSENLLKYLVVQKMPIYQDKLVFEMDEVKSLHKTVKKVIDKGEKAHLVTTFGDVELLRIAENDTVANEVLLKAFKAIFNNAGFNSGMFTADSVTALKMSLVRDKGYVYRYVQVLLNFYSIAINNAFDFKNYQADIDILPISPYTYEDDIKQYKDNATLGVGKIDYIIATGIKQKNIEDNFKLEDVLQLDKITPMQTSYTQTAEDRVNDSSSDNQDDKTPVQPQSPEIEPSDKKEEGQDK